MKRAIQCLLIPLIFFLVTGFSQTGKQEESRAKVDSEAGLYSFEISSLQIEDALKYIAEKSKIRLSYSKDILPKNKIISLNLDNTTAENALKTVLAGTGAEVIAAAGNKFIITTKERYLQEAGSIKGKIISAASSEVLIGANIIAIGTSRGAATDINGMFSFTIAPGVYSLRITSIGYKTTIIDSVVVLPNKETSIDVSLQEDTYQSNEVVVVGYGVQYKQDVTGSISSVNMKDVQKVPTSNSLMALQGQVPGVNIEQASGAPGTNPIILIRGIGTIGNTDPLYIIDGIPSSVTALSYVNPSDLESIDILKDASAAAIYGSRAANGVVIVNTKRGRPGAVKIQLNSYYGIQHLGKFISLTNSDQYIQVAKMVAKNAGLTAPKFVTAYEADPAKFANTDWQKSYYDDAGFKKFDINLSGGTDLFNYSIAGSYAPKEGVAKNTRSDLKSLRVNSDLKKGNFKAGESISYGRTTTDYVTNTGTEAGYQVIAMPPIIPVYDPKKEGGFGGTDKALDEPDPSNPIGFNNLTKNQDDRDYFSLSGYAQYEFIPNLIYKFNVGQTINNYHSLFYQPTFKMSSTDFREKAYLSESRSRSSHIVYENTLSYLMSIDKHNISALVGYSQEKNEYTSIGASVQNFPNNYLQQLSLGTESPNVSGSKIESSLRSYFGRVNYSYDDKYLFQGNIRRDGSSRFSSANRYGVFPSASIGWRMSKEEFFKPVPYVNDFKLRASYGVLGNQEIGDYAFIAGISTNNDRLNYVFGQNQTIYTGSSITGFPSFDIKWEQTKTTDFGFDLSLFNDKLSLTADYYIKTTSDMLVQVPIPTSNGVDSGPIINGGEMENKGFDFSATYKDYEGEFKYSVGVNFSTYSNEIKKLGYSDEAIWGGYPSWDAAATTKSVVGGSVGQFWLFQSAGLFQSDAEAANYKNSNGDLLQPNAKAGDVKFLDVNGDGVLDDKDRVDMGSAIPKAELGLNLTASYENFDLHLFFRGEFGRKLFNGMKWNAYRMRGYLNYPVEALNAWTPTNTNTDIPRAVYGDPNDNSRPSDRFLENGSYFRLQNIEIGYTIPPSFFSITPGSTIRIYVSAENLFTITDYTGYDPGFFGSDGNIFARGVDRAVYPITKTYVTGIQVNL